MEADYFNSNGYQGAIIYPSLTSATTTQNFSTLTDAQLQEHAINGNYFVWNVVLESNNNTSTASQHTNIIEKKWVNKNVIYYNKTNGNNEIKIPAKYDPDHLPLNIVLERENASSIGVLFNDLIPNTSIGTDGYFHITPSNSNLGTVAPGVFNYTIAYDAFPFAIKEPGQIDLTKIGNYGGFHTGNDTLIIMIGGNRNTIEDDIKDLTSTSPDKTFSVAQNFNYIDATYNTWYIAQPNTNFIENNAYDIGTGIDSIIKICQANATNIRHIVLFGHSFGGIQIRTMLCGKGRKLNVPVDVPFSNYNINPQIEKVIFLASPHRGITNGSLSFFAGNAASEMTVGSQFLTDLENNFLPAGIKFLNITGNDPNNLLSSAEQQPSDAIVPLSSSQNPILKKSSNTYFHYPELNQLYVNYDVNDNNINIFDNLHTRIHRTSVLKSSNDICNSNYSILQRIFQFIRGRDVNTSSSSVTVSGGGTYCNSAILTASNVSGETIYWQNTISGGISTATPSTSQTVTTSGTYYFRSRNSWYDSQSGENGFCWGIEGSATVIINSTSPPSTPTGLTATAISSSQINLSWNAVAGAIGYDIYYCDGTYIGFTTNTSYSHTGRAALTTYAYKISAQKNSTCSSPQTTCISATTPAVCTPPSIPTGLTATAVSSSQINLSWNAVAGAIGYDIYYCDGTYIGFTANTTYSHTGRAASTTYAYKISAQKNSTCSSPQTTCISATTPAVCTPPSIPTGLTATAVSSSQINLSWNAVAGAIGYDIYYCDGTYIGFTANTTYSHTGRAASTTYAYKISAQKNSTCSSPQTSCTSAITLACSNMPSEVTVSGSGAYCNNTTLTASGGSGGTIYWQGNTNGGVSTSTPSSSQIVTSSGTYYFRAYNNCGWGVQGSATVSINTSAPLPIPTGLTATAVSSSQINLNWNAVAGAIGYDIYYCDGTYIGFTTNTSYQHTGRAASTIYAYKISAQKNSTCSSSQTSCVSAATPSACTPPSTPTGLTATAVSSSQINLSWNAVAGAIGYDISYCDGTYIGFTSNTTYIHTGRVASTTYAYKISAQKNSTCSSPQTTCISATTPAVCTPPSTPTGLTATAVSSSQINLSWNAVAGVTGYDIYYCDGTYIGFTSNTTYSHTGRAASTTYSYKISAQKSSTCSSSQTSCTSAITLACSNIPTEVTVSGSGAYCNNATLTASGGSGGTIYWQGNTNGGESTATSSSSQIVSSSGTYYFRAYNNCGWGVQGSATVIINTIPNPPDANSNSPICEGDPLNLTALGQPGAIYSWIGPNALSSFQQNPTISYTTTLNSGLYYVTQTIAGCTSNETTITTSIYPRPSTPIITQNGNTLESGSLSLNQWYLNGIAIPGAINQNYNPISSGNYSVIVNSIGGCVSDASNVINFVLTGLNEFSNNKNIRIYPNPATNNLIIECQKQSTIEILNTQAQLIESFTTTGNITSIDVSSYSNGMYCIRVKTENEIVMKKFVKE